MSWGYQLAIRFFVFVSAFANICGASGGATGIATGIATVATAVGTMSFSATAKTDFCTHFLYNMRFKRELSKTRRQFDPNDFFWQFPSDHLPVVGEVRLSGSSEPFRVITWNVLNESYLGFITNGTQGLQHSGITATEDRSGDIYRILMDLYDDIRPEVIALQEVDAALLSILKVFATAHGLELLQTENPSPGRSGKIVDYGVVLFDRQRLIEVSGLRGLAHFAGPSKYIQRYGFRTLEGQTFLFTNIHRDHFDTETLQTYFRYPSFLPSIIVGDFNWNLHEIRKELSRAPEISMMAKLADDFTHIDKFRKLQDYDQILYRGDLTVRSLAKWNLKARKHFQL